jgi:putative transposase
VSVSFLIKRTSYGNSFFSTKNKTKEVHMNFLYENYSLFINPITEFITNLYQKMMIEERQIYLEEYCDTKGNGFYKRAIKTLFGKFQIKVPRTRDDNFKSQLFNKGACDEAVEQLIRLLYKNGCSQRKIDEILMKAYGVNISHSTVSKLGKIASKEVALWRERPLQEHYVVLFIDAFYFPIKRDTVEKEAVYVAIGILPNGVREILGFDIPGGCEGSSNWREIFKSFKKRGVKRIDFLVADGLTGIKNVIEEEFNKTSFQYCVLHAVRSSSNKVRPKDRKKITEDMKEIYQADSIDKARLALGSFETNWKRIYPKVVLFWEENFNDLTAFMKLPKEMWKFVYTTNSVERLHKEVKRRIKVMEQFQNVESACAILYMLYSDYNDRYKQRRLNHWESNYVKYEKRTDSIFTEELMVAI